jgi:DNA polymerase-3 subunit gamma/tau
MLGLVDPKFITDIFNAIFAKDYAQIVEFIKVLEDYESEMVVDELIAYLKERMYNQDALYSTLVLDRFFRVLSDSKYLFSVNADGSFVLSLIFFKMIEALRIREIDQMIESLQKEVQRPEIVLPEKAKIKVQSTTPEMSPKPEQQSTQEFAPEPTVEPIVEPIIVDSGVRLFEELVAKIKDRNYELGECFTNTITYISYQDNILTWESCADGDCKKSLTHGYSVVKQLVREIFSFETKIKGMPCTKSPKKEEPEPSEFKNNNSVRTHMQQPQMNGPQSDTMIEDAEMGGDASCVTNCSTSTPLEEQNGTDITQEPMVQKAIEMFEARKVTVQSKI